MFGELTSIEFILYIEDQKRSTDFYITILEKKPVLNVPGMTEFELSENVKLGLMPESGIVKILGNKITNRAASDISRCELYIKTADLQNKYRYLLQKQIEILKTPADMNWGDTVFYLRDPDGHIIAFAQTTKI